MSLDQVDQIEEQKTIVGARFTLRPLRVSDAGLIAHYAGDIRVSRRTSSIPHPLPPGAAEAFVARAMKGDDNEIIWAIDGTSDGGPELKGIVSLKRMDRAQSEIGYWIAPPFWNTGLAADALALLIDANPFGDTAMFTTVFQDNPEGAQVMTGQGFEYLGDAETYSVAREATVPTWTYSRKLA